jgi:transposase
MAWLRIQLTEQEQAAVNAERDAHPDAHVRRKMLVLWLLHCGLGRQKAAEVALLARASIQRYVAAYRDGGLDGLRRWGVTGPVSDLAAHAAGIKEEFTRLPARTIAEAAQRIEDLTGIRRQPSQVRKFLKGLGLKFQRVRAVPVPPKKVLPST